MPPHGAAAPEALRGPQARAAAEALPPPPPRRQLQARLPGETRAARPPRPAKPAVWLLPHPLPRPAKPAARPPPHPPPAPPAPTPPALAPPAPSPPAPAPPAPVASRARRSSPAKCAPQASVKPPRSSASRAAKLPSKSPPHAILRGPPLANRTAACKSQSSAMVATLHHGTKKAGALPTALEARAVGEPAPSAVGGAGLELDSSTSPGAPRCRSSSASSRAFRARPFLMVVCAV
mmetsp:Transcript_112745/g.351548  ORF Transcript_112745/g.351548 Transcript_112745/m.351548 type:complete len:235 (-) Transcript_112745:508-1212(-)